MTRWGTVSRRVFWEAHMPASLSLRTFGVTAALALFATVPPATATPSKPLPIIVIHMVSSPDGNQVALDPIGVHIQPGNHAFWLCAQQALAAGPDGGPTGLACRQRHPGRRHRPSPLAVAARREARSGRLGGHEGVGEQGNDEPGNVPHRDHVSTTAV